MNYTTADKEMLAIVQTMKKFRHMLQGTKLPVIVKSDHKNLRTFMTTKELNARQARWAEELCGYDFRIEHVKGKENKVADALSRRADYRENGTPGEMAPMLVEDNGRLSINKQVKLKMVHLEDANTELYEGIREATKKDAERTELEIEEDGFKRFRGLIFIPKEKEKAVMQRFHDNILEGHPGIARTMEKIQRSFYFAGMYRKLKKYIKECDSCNRNKNQYQKPKGTMTIEENLPTRPWRKLTADFMEMPKTTNMTGTETFDELLLVVDTFSKQTIMIPRRKTATTEEIFQLLWERVFSVFGIPESILSDRDKIFRTQRWQTLMAGIGSTQILSTAHHQQTDGQTERKIQEIRAYFRHYLDYTQENWIQLTPLAQYAVNDAKSSATDETPNFITFGTERKFRRATNRWRGTYTPRTYEDNPSKGRTGHSMDETRNQKVL